MNRHPVPACQQAERLTIRPGVRAMRSALPAICAMASERSADDLRHRRRTPRSPHRPPKKLLSMVKIRVAHVLVAQHQPFGRRHVGQPEREMLGRFQVDRLLGVRYRAVTLPLQVAAKLRHGRVELVTKFNQLLDRILKLLPLLTQRFGVRGARWVALSAPPTRSGLRRWWQNP